MSNDDLFNKWNVWLEAIYDDVQGLLINRHIYQETQEVIRANPRIQIESAFYEWMGIVYASTQAIGVRRQVDARPEVVSFASLLGEIKEKPEILSRQRFTTLYGGTGVSKEDSDLDFEKFSGKDQPHVDPQRVEADLAEMKKKADKIRMYVNKRITHFNRSDFKNAPIFADLDDSLDFLETLLKKYLGLFRVNMPVSIAPVWQYDWKKIFKTPWIE